MSSLLALEGLTKRYGDLVAVDRLDLELKAGEILALVGENGAGKSTVVKMLSGMARPDAGSIRIDGQAVEIPTPRTAQSLGIGVVHQHYSLVPSFTVAESIALGQIPLTGFDRKRASQRVERISEETGIAIDPDARIGSLDVAGQQRVEILKALSNDVRILVLDEPTSVLTPEDQTRLFDMLARLCALNVAVILITHKLADVYSVCQRVAVLHSGRKAADIPVDKVDREDLVSLMMTGKAGARDAAGHSSAQARPAETAETHPVRMEVRDVGLRRANGSHAASDVSFELRAGEILGIAGVDGNGQAELIRCLAGLEQPASGSIRIGKLESSDARNWTPRRLRQAGVAHIAEDRQRYAILPSLALSENFLLCRFFRDNYSRAGFIDRRRATAETCEAIKEYDIKTSGPRQPIRLLSGGNQQKLVLARELMDSPLIVLASHPTRGLDFRTIEMVQNRLSQERDAGAAIVLVSASVDEIWELADRIVVMAAGSARGPVAKSQTTPAEIGSWMAGH